MFGFRKKAKPLVMPEPAWDGVHRLTDIRFCEFEGTGNGDYYSGYRWVCSCGSVSPVLPPRWYATEEKAAQAHREHRGAYERSNARMWKPRPEFFEFPPHGKHG